MEKVKRKPGRPSTGQARLKRFSLLLSEQEFIRLKMLAYEEGISLSAFIRKLVF